MSTKASRRPLLCRTNLHHHWHDELTSDGESYRRCSRCGKDRSDFDNNDDGSPPNVAGNMAANLIGRPQSGWVGATARSTVEPMITVDAVAKLAVELPQVSEGERYQHRTWFVQGKAFAWVRPFSKADIRRYGDETPPAEPILAVAVADLSDKQAALAAYPLAFFTIPHFDGYAAVLIELNKATKTVVREALVDAWSAAAPHALVEEYRHG